MGDNILKLQVMRHIISYPTKIGVMDIFLQQAMLLLTQVITIKKDG